MTIDALLKTIEEEHKELQQYRSIGTVEEFKTFKENERKCQDCAGCTNWKCDCANERAYAIDKFAEALHLKEFDNEYGTNIVLTPKDVDEIAEQMKAGTDDK